MPYAVILIILCIVISYFFIKSFDKNIVSPDDISFINENRSSIEKENEVSTYYGTNKKTSCRGKLIKSLDKSYANILNAYEYIDRDVRNKKDVIPAAEWLLDNLFLIEKEYKDIKHNMPISYYKDLPVIIKGMLKGFPRIYSIALDIVSKNDGRVEESSIEQYIKEYQKNVTLTSGELWALPIMLRIALIQNINKVIDKMIFAQKEKNRAENIADRLIDAVVEKRLNSELLKLSDECDMFTSHFTERLLKVLRDNGVDNGDIYRWIDEKLEIQDSSSEKMINIEHQKQASFQLSMGNCISGIREVEAINWRESFEGLSYVEEILRKDPIGIYEKMDFESRDYYRHEIEKLSKRVNIAEGFVAKKAIECALEAPKDSEREYLNHIGYYIFDDGQIELRKKINYKNNYKDRFIEYIKGKRVAWYEGTIILGTLLIICLILLLSLSKDSNIELWRYIVAVLILLIPCSEIVVSILNWSINRLSEPRFVPKLQFFDSVPEEKSAVVVIPTILNDVKRVHDLVNDMEVYYLANQIKNIYFALLGDFKDSTSETSDSDKDLENAAIREIKLLNDKYASEDRGDIFFYFNRVRQYNKKENLWMGWERKRGKLIEFNSLLRGNTQTSYNVISGSLEKLKKVKYVITLDADTQLPRDSAKMLIGAMAHVLNIPHIEKGKKKITRGYGVMQPRVSISTVSANKTLFSRIFSGETGIDIYSTAVSDVYQDVFKEGIFTGKGIYDVDIFNYMLSNEIPDETILSHDLLEGCYVRTALVTDIELIDGYPSYYNSSSKRLHRWVRGDWQLLPWIFKRNPALNRLSKWKMIDNLRRSMLAPSIIILIILSLIILPNGIDKWLTIAALSIIIPILFDVSDEIVSPIRGISLSGRIDSGKTVFEQVFLLFCFLPYQGYLMLDAIFRTIYRVYISKRKLLQWQTSADVENYLDKSFTSFLKEMWKGSAISLIIIILSFYRSYKVVLLLLPSCILWFISPYLAYYISKPIKKGVTQLSSVQIDCLIRLCRKSYSYFEDFVSSETNWLSPDNFQADPENGIACRTSPTNMAMGLMSNIVAYDMGFIGVMEMEGRLNSVLSNMEQLKKYRGHFYNWYDTNTKETLKPEYISTVDSGNLVGYEWVVSQSLYEYLDKPFINSKLIQGLVCLLTLGEEEIEKFKGIKFFYKKIIDETKNKEVDIISWKTLLLDIWGKVMELHKFEDEEELYYNRKIKATVSKFIKELQKFFPWADIILERSERMNEVADKLKDITCKASIRNLCMELNNMINEIEAISGKSSEDEEWLEQLKLLLSVSKKEVAKEVNNILNLIERLNKLADETDFSILYDKKRQLFSIGYDIEKDSIGNCYYDLLASEARQASFVAIAKGDVEQKHWFKLGRAMTVIGRTKGLVSWSGTMFEYFMPLLIMKNYPNTLLNETYQAVVDGQMRYCKERRVPWGISESAFYSFDLNLNYQYKAFGVPGIGLKRGLNSELVIAPYSTVMALQINPVAAYNNIVKLENEGLKGKYGFYEAVDYTKERIPKGKKKAIVKCFMIHHEGMSIMALDNVLNYNILQERFHRVPKVKATELLLQEKVPKRIIYDREQQFDTVDAFSGKQNIILRTFNTAKTETPESELLSNGSYSVMITNSGSGYSKKDDTFINRWREDVTLDNSGIFFYIKDITHHNYFSACYAPCMSEGDEYKTVFSLDKAEFIKKNGDILTKTEIAVSNEDNAEVRKLTITNHGKEDIVLEITSYFEVVLTSLGTDLVHPAFSNLFVATEFFEEQNCLIAYRKPRSKGQKKVYCMQTVAVQGETVGAVQYETSRINFIGRDRTLKNPYALQSETPLKNTTGAVLDPIFSIRRRIRISSGENCKLAYTTAIGTSREEMIEMASKYSEMNNIKRVFELSYTQTQVEMKYLGIKSAQANFYQLMASKILFLNSQFRDREQFIKGISKGQSSLWPYGISGDVPIVLLMINKDSDLDYIRQMLNAHEYWSIKGLKVDFVVLNNQSASYIQSLQNSVRDLISSSHARDKQNKQGGVFLLNSGTLPKEDKELLIASARIVIDSKNGLISAQLKSNERETNPVKDLQPQKQKYSSNPINQIIEKLQYFNDLGGFSEDGKEYIIILREGKTTPAPWINVIANRNFGFQVSESGSAYTWCLNSREHKITPWSNDWVSDTSGELLFIRDEVSLDLWNVTPMPKRDNGQYIIRHGFGYSKFSHEAFGIFAELTMFVSMNKNIKACCLKLKNTSNIKRSLSVTYFAQLVMGVVPQNTSQYISTYINKEKGYIYAINPYSDSFKNQKAFLYVFGGSEESFTGDRKEFLGRGKTIDRPLGLEKDSLSNSEGSGFDPCLAENCKFTLNADEDKEILILLGEESSTEKIEEIISGFKTNGASYELDKVKEYWEDLIGSIRVSTPDKSMDLLLNGWLMYQTIVCRIFARSAFYQSGGAYGFRDQLQDVLSLSYLKPDMVKSQILLSATRQYEEGDVQHWWHPIVDSGIRTRFSDDLLWLPYVVSDYINKTGDISILDEEAGYLYEEPLKDGEDERYNIAGKSEEKGSIYEHCIKAIDKALRFGEHNIPLMGSGDWNDGMSTVGNKGKGESVWLGWFLYDIVNKFKDISKDIGDIDKSNRYSEMAKFIKENLERNAWDGNWYRRAYFDDGTPLGSMENDECQIDSISQTWAVISKAADFDRSKIAMTSLEEYLINEDKGLVLLLTPPFSKSKLEPGYIKGYVPGVRENGGQYTHSVTWVILAFVELNEGYRAWKVFNMINPINHTKSYLECEIYKTEPYVMSADVYARDPHVGRGGWSWYTGAAGWMYKAGIEGILGLKLNKGEGFSIKPSIPDNWNTFNIIYKTKGAVYNIKVQRSENKGLYLDGKPEDDFIPFMSEGEHEVLVNI